MKTLIHLLLITIMLVFVRNAEANSNLDEQIEFVAGMTNHMNRYSEIISSVDITNDSSCSEAQEDILDLYSTVSTMELPEGNTPIYDVLQYCHLNALDYAYNGLDTNLSLEERSEVLTDSIQYLNISSTITTNASDLITN